MIKPSNTWNRLRSVSNIVRAVVIHQAFWFNIYILSEMDSQDSSSPVITSRDGSFADEDGQNSISYGLAKEAAFLFQSRRFDECIDVLNQLSQKKEDDPKILHNIAVVEYFRDGCSDPRKLFEVLNKVKKRSEDLARAAREKVEIGSNIGNNIISGSKGSSTTSSSTKIVYTDEFDTSVATFNIAVVLFHLHEYAYALSLLEPLYQNIEPIDETIALHICLLLLDIALASNDATRAADVIQYLEKAFGVGYMIGHGENVSNAQHQSSNPPIKTFSAPSNSTALDSSNLDSTANTNSSEIPLARTFSEEALDYETLLSTLDNGGKYLARPASLTSSNNLLRTSANQPASAVDLKLKLHLYKVRLLLLTQNLKAAKREVKLAMNIARGRDSSTALLLKSQLEYARGNHRKAIKLLMTSSNQMESGMPSLFNNNLGCIYHQLRKQHTSTLFFSKALKSTSSVRSQNPLKLLTFSQDKSLLIVYNCGLQYLACGKPLVAARCFQKASSVFYTQPLLWLRISECCLLALEKGLLKSSWIPTSEVRVHVVGRGKWRQLVVENGTSRNRNFESMEQNDGPLDGDDQTKLSVSFARQCLLNALHLLSSFELKSSESGLASGLEEDESYQGASNAIVVSAQVSANGDSKDLKGGASPYTTQQSSVSAHEVIYRREEHMIKQAVLADLAYVELNLENPLKALSAAMYLLRLPECSRTYTFLGHTYAAEALCHLNRLKEAADHLLVYMLDGNNAELPYSEEDRNKWCVDKAGDSELNGGLPMGESQDIQFLKPEEAHGTLYVNLATMSAIQGDLKQAQRFATEGLSIIPNNPKAVLTSAYLDLLLGKSQDAIAKLKQCSHVRILPISVASNSSS